MVEGEFCLEFDLNDQRVRTLIRTDETLGRLIQYIGTSELPIEKDGFRCLVKYIIGQQISDKARETIWRRFCVLYSPISPENILSISDESLRKLGLSGRKVSYIKILAKCSIKNQIDYVQLQNLSNEEVIARLTTLKGIGRWTAEMYLIFSLGRINVLSKNDGTIKRAIRWMYNCNELPSSEDLLKYFVNWEGYETIVSSYLWKAISLGLTKVPFNKLICEERSRAALWV